MEVNRREFLVGVAVTAATRSMGPPASSHTIIAPETVAKVSRLPCWNVYWGDGEVGGSGLVRALSEEDALRLFASNNQATCKDHKCHFHHDEFEKSYKCPTAGPCGICGVDDVNAPSDDLNAYRIKEFDDIETPTGEDWIKAGYSVYCIRCREYLCGPDYDTVYWIIDHEAICEDCITPDDADRLNGAEGEELRAELAKPYREILLMNRDLAKDCAEAAGQRVMLREQKEGVRPGDAIHHEDGRFLQVAYVTDTRIYLSELLLKNAQFLLEDGDTDFSGKISEFIQHSDAVFERTVERSLSMWWPNEAGRPERVTVWAPVRLWRMVRAIEREWDETAADAAEQIVETCSQEPGASASVEDEAELDRSTMEQIGHATSEMATQIERSESSADSAVVAPKRLSASSIGGDLWAPVSDELKLAIEQ